MIAIDHDRNRFTIDDGNSSITSTSTTATTKSSSSASSTSTITTAAVVTETKTPSFFIILPSKFITLKLLYRSPISALLTKDDNSNNNGCEIRKAKNDSNLKKDEFLAKYVLSIPKAIRMNGLLLQGYLVYPKVLRRIENFEIRTDDVWLCTYPKSGTTWTEEILSLIFADGDIDAVSKKIIAERVPHLEVGKPFGHLKWLRSIRSPRLLATHLNVENIPGQLRQGKAKIIYVVRNPKDNAVSYYHHHRMSTFLGNYSGTWDDFVELFARGDLVYGSWIDHVRGFWELKQQDPDSVLFVSYEELKVDLKKMIGIICDFVGHRLTDEQIDRITLHCSFEKMRNNKMVNREDLPVADLFDMSKTKFMRKGIIGDWRNHFTAEQSQRFDEIFEPELKRIGLPICYDHHNAEEIMEKYGRIIRTNE
ncbi:sulfotransferase 1B1 [Dermatophagoides farinae]|uniref:sulfotransferase 1B1 n=1 Tax=Dermatophagoides farinae TaxID=6954 RepID=UPI003F5F7CA3